MTVTASVTASTKAATLEKARHSAPGAAERMNMIGDDARRSTRKSSGGMIVHGVQIPYTVLQAGLARMRREEKGFQAWMVRLSMINVPTTPVLALDVVDEAANRLLQRERRAGNIVYYCSKWMLTKLGRTRTREALQCA
jgi:hypothetical protein